MEHKLFPVIFLLVPLTASAAGLADVTGCSGQNYGFDLADYHATPPFPDKWVPNEFHKACLDVSSMRGAQVCMAGKNGMLGSEETTYALTYEISGQPKLTWNISGYQIGDARSFTIQEASMTGGAAKDIVVGILTGGSNGLGTSYYSLYAITDSGKKLVGPIEVEDYGVVSGLYHDPHRQGCVLLVSKWKGDTEPGRGDGLYAKGRWYVLKGGVFAEYDNLPAVERRFLYRFADEIRNDSKLQPLLWFQDKTARLLKN